MVTMDTSTGSQIGQGSSTEEAARPVNVGELERYASAIAGGALVLGGLKRRSWLGLAVAGVGTMMLRRGITGYCPAYRAMGVTDDDRTFASNPLSRAMRVERSIDIRQPVEPVYQFCRDLANLPKFMDRLESVQVTGPEHAHWIARGPGNMKFEWDSETTEHRPNELLAWRSTGGDIENSGWVRFQALPDNQGTHLTCALTCRLPGGLFAAAIARLLGEDPAKQLEKDLKRFKQVLETGVPAQ